VTTQEKTGGAVADPTLIGINPAEIVWIPAESENNDSDLAAILLFFPDITVTTRCIIITSTCCITDELLHQTTTGCYRILRLLHETVYSMKLFTP
jgi:hypothetical protein